MRSPLQRRHDKGVSLAKGPALVVGTILVVFGLAGLVQNNDFPSFSSAFPDGTAQGETLLGIEVNGWTGWLCIAAGALLLFGLAQHLVAKAMSLVVGLALAAAALFAVVDGEDVLGLAAANGATKLLFAVASVVLLVNVLMPRVGARRDEAGATRAVEAEDDRERTRARDRDMPTVHDREAEEDFRWEDPSEEERVQRSGRFSRDPGSRRQSSKRA